MTKRILVIDDDAAIRKSFALTLEDADYLVDTADCGEIGLDMVSRQVYDLVFLDLKMPGINGIETLIRLRDMGSDMPIYVVTAFHEDFIGQLQTIVAKGYTFEILRKPIDGRDLLSVTNAILNGVGIY